ncbi:basement membrane proteoglycan-like [Centruroides sculpturatus]|uniref:basement membrane proteoglycan-like n=1 Tax=Centruroides sculpturatus TaxID=218467 RepID=UPI000C6D4B70|nr:basement membrane proteoglycan-like [Centruroides sculpturatus]
MKKYADIRCGNDAIVMPVKTEDDYNNLFNTVLCMFFGYSWVGVEKIDGEWKNLDGSDVPDSIWAEGEPSDKGECGLLSCEYNYKLVAEECNTKGGVVCIKKEKKSTTSTTTTTKPTTTTPKPTTTTPEPTTTTPEPTTTTTTITPTTTEVFES